MLIAICYGGQGLVVEIMFRNWMEVPDFYIVLGREVNSNGFTAC